MITSEFLLGVRLFLHLATVLLLACYCRPCASFRLGPSVMAGLLLASSASLATQIIFEWHTLAQLDPHPQLVIFVFTVFIPIAYARGNVARIYVGLSRLGPSWRSWFKL